jgi:hypothetical protein
MEEIQTKLFAPDIEERESEALNIEYEKLVTELESTKEYQAEKAAEEKKWKDENLPLNAYATLFFLLVFLCFLFPFSLSVLRSTNFEMN